jgi:signal transduction histidine kinase
VIALRRALVTIGATALVLGLISIPVILTSQDQSPRGAFLASELIVGWSFVGVGLFMWWRQPENRLGMLMTAVGFTWLLQVLLATSDGYLFVLGELLAAIPYGFLVQMLLSFPDGRLHSRLELAVVALTWFDVTIMEWLPLPFEQFPRLAGCKGCPANPLLASNHQSLASALMSAQTVIAFVILAGLIVALIRRWRALAPTQRTVVSPVIWTGTFALVALTAALATKLGSSVSQSSTIVYYLGLPLLAAVPYAFLAGLLQSRFTRAEAITELVSRLSAGPDSRRSIRDVLAETFGDRSLVLAYWLPERGRYVNADGHEIELPSGGDRAWAPVTRDGEPLAAIIYDAALVDERQLLEAAGAAAALALENERLGAELRARVDELERSRERIIAVGLEERRKLERNLHDGAQQRLVALALDMRLVRDRLVRDPDGARELLDESLVELDSATAELRELARGIHPAVLSDRGLPAALKTLAGRVPIPVDLVETPSERLPARVEIASYYVIAEALTNVAKYAHACSAQVRVRQLNGSISVEVTDDGVGGADPTHGSGLRGLADRVAALDGRLEIVSREGHGTTVKAQIPCG